MRQRLGLAVDHRVGQGPGAVDPQELGALGSRRQQVLVSVAIGIEKAGAEDRLFRPVERAGHEPFAAFVPPQGHRPVRSDGQDVGVAVTVDVGPRSALQASVELESEPSVAAIEESVGVLRACAGGRRNSDHSGQQNGDGNANRRAGHRV